MSSLTTLRDLMGLGHEPGSLADAALVMIDCQNTYREGVMQLSGVEAALIEARRVLDQARALGRPVIHIQHDAGPGTPYVNDRPAHRRHRCAAGRRDRHHEKLSEQFRTDLA